MFQAHNQRKLHCVNNKSWMHLLYLCFLILLIPSVSIALPADEKQPLRITADTTSYNIKSGLKVFAGHVHAERGSMHITADKITAKSNHEQKIEEIIAYGINELAHYWMEPKAGDPEIHANAEIIKFYPIVSNITLSKRVMIKQGKNSFQGELIHYNINDQTITVPASNSAQSVLVFNPE